MRDTLGVLVLWIIILVVLNLDDNLMRDIGAWGAEIVKGYREALP